MIDLLLTERLAARRTRASRYRCESCDRAFEGWGPVETIRCPDCSTPVGHASDSRTPRER